MYKSEKHTIYYVLGLYLSSTLLLIATLFISYYYYEKEQLKYEEIKELKKFTTDLIQELSVVHENKEDKYKYPIFEKFNSAIYDIDKNLIFSTLSSPIDKIGEEFFIKKDKSYYLSTIKTHYLGAAYIVVEKDTREFNILLNLLMIAFFVVMITIITSFFLVKIVLKPMRDSLHLLDNFIKDTTHELNTPITTILTNIETLDSTKCDEKSLKKLERIKIASISISNLYEDLVYLLLNHKTYSEDEELNISEALKQRVLYFTLMATSKKIKFKLNIEENVKIIIDKKKFERLIDNILSNAIKYTKISTTIDIVLTKTSLSMRDEGEGLSERDIENKYKKYTRFNKAQGGFGIGYSIIKSITEEYDIKINIDSKEKKGTKVTLSW